MMADPVTPSRCLQCKVLFGADWMLVAEVRHVALTVGAGAARALFEERLADAHAAHTTRTL